MTHDEAKKLGATHYHTWFWFMNYYKRDNDQQLYRKFVDGVWIPSFICPTKPKPLNEWFFLHQGD